MTPHPARQEAKAGKPISLSPEEHERLLAQAKQAESALRQLADLDNARKRLQREKEEANRFAAEAVIRQMLPILDSLSQALVAVDNQSDPKAVIQGVHLIYRQLLGLLEKEGVKRIPTIGERFDPHQHEAVAQAPTDDHAADGTVVEEVQVGYTMHGRVLRPAMVKVAKRSDQKSDI
jgi:molecular chaperone GrpE